jgi:hypothetical protein
MPWGSSEQSLSEPQLSHVTAQVSLTVPSTVARPIVPLSSSKRSSTELEAFSLTRNTLAVLKSTASSAKESPNEDHGLFSPFSTCSSSFLLPAGVYVPFSQAVHSTACGSALIRPASQRVHKAAPPKEEKPAAQFAQIFPFIDRKYFPDAHGKHAVNPVSLPKVPGVQYVQALT